MSHGNRVPTGVQRILSDIRSLNSSVLLISQKMKYVVRNEKILGRNLIVLSRKIKALEEKIVHGGLPGAGADIDSEAVNALVARIEETNRRLAALEVDIDEIRQTAASKETLAEMKYVIDSINPLEYVTVDQLKSMLAKKKR